MLDRGIDLAIWQPQIREFQARTALFRAHRPCASRLSSSHVLRAGGADTPSAQPKRNAVELSCAVQSAARSKGRFREV